MLGKREKLIGTFSGFSGFVVILAIAHQVAGQSSTMTWQSRTDKREYWTRQRMSPYVPHDYMKKEIYMIHWLRGLFKGKKTAAFNIKMGEDLLLANLKWRKENRMDYILEEDFSHFLTKFSPVFLDTVGKKGQPVVTHKFWNYRRAHMSRQNGTLVRYVMRSLEKGAALIRQGQQNGQNNTRVELLLNMEGFNLIQHGCSPCLRTYNKLLTIYDKYFPGLIDRVILINAPPLFRAILEPIGRQAVNADTIRSLDFKIFGTEKNNWRPYLLSIIDKNQLAQDFGGNKAQL